MNGNTSLTISIISIVFLLALSCQAKKESSSLAPTNTSNSLVRAAPILKSDSAASPTLDTMSVFKQVLKYKGKSYAYENDTIEIKYGYIFSKKQKHLFVKLINIVEHRIEFRFYFFNKNRFNLMHYSLMGLNTYNGYALLDVNDDTYKDFVLTWHPGNKSGQDCYYVFLYRNNGTFSLEDLSFCNSIFYPKAKIVRGQEYDPVYYTFRWNNAYSLDTIEYVYAPIMYNWITDLPWKDSRHYHKIDYTKNKKVTLLDDAPGYYFNREAEYKQKALFKK